MKPGFILFVLTSAVLLVGVALTATRGGSTPPQDLDSVSTVADFEKIQSVDTVDVTYDFTQPTLEIRLPRMLREISALSMDESGRLLAVQDETGFLFTIDPGTGEIIKRERFESGGDYEGLERVGDRVLVLRSSGHLYTVSGANPNRKTTTRQKLRLPGDCDAEALGYDDIRDIILVGCKSGDGVRGRRGRSIFAFDRSGGSLSDEPYLFIDDDLLAAACGDCSKRSRAFNPSAIAVQPTTGELYILSATNELLLIYSPESSKLIKLKLDRLPQPEGLTFDRDGVLYIASEGQSKKATLYAFNPIKN